MKIKSIISSLCIAALCAFAFQACNDVPAPYDIPQMGDASKIYGTGTLETPYTIRGASLNQNGGYAWVKAYIVGYIPQSTDGGPSYTISDVVFSADGASSDSVIRLAFANNMPFFTQSAGSLFNGTMGRGAYIEIRNNDVQLNLYKNTVVYNPNMSGNITSVNLLDGNEHTMTIIVTEEETTITGTAVVAAYKVYVIIDGTTYTAAIPIANDLSEIYTTSGSSGIDPESVVDSADSIFLSSSRYVGIEVVGGLTFDLKGIYVF